MLSVNNWSRALDPSFGIPTDVTFKVIEDEQVLVHLIPAHKYFLAMASPVFKAMFFGPARETKDVVPIRGTSSQAFCSMIDYIYEKEICWDDRSVFSLLEVVNLAEMYNLDNLMEKVGKVLRDYPLTKETVIQVAYTAKMFSHFEDISYNLLSSCATFLATQVLKNKDEIKQFVSRYIDSPYYSIAFELREMAKEVPPIKCENCLQVECEDRLPLSMDNMREGCRVLVRLRPSRMEVLGRLVEECKDHSGQVWWVREVVDAGEETEDEEMMLVKLINLFFACKV